MVLAVGLDIDQVPGERQDPVPVLDRTRLRAHDFAVLQEGQAGDRVQGFAGVHRSHELAEGDLALTDDHRSVEFVRQHQIRTHRGEPAADEARQVGVLLAHLLGRQPAIGDHVAQDPGGRVQDRALASCDQSPVALLAGVQAAVDDLDLVAVGQGKGRDGQHLERQHVLAGLESQGVVDLLGLVEDDLLLALDHGERERQAQVLIRC